MHHLLRNVKKEGDFDVFLNKWVDVLNRDIAWELKKSSFKKVGDAPAYRDKGILEADFTDGEQTFHFKTWNIEYEYKDYKDDRMHESLGDTLSGISISYVPDSSGKKLSLQLSFDCSGGFLDDYFTNYEVIVRFNSKSGKKEGHAKATMVDDWSEHRPKPCNSDYECIVGENFYSMLIGFCKKMRETAMENAKKKEQAKQNNIKDEFDSL